LSLRVADDGALDFYEHRLARAGVASARMADRLVFADPEGLGLELVIDDREDEPLVAAAADVDGDVAIRGIHAARAYSADAARSKPVVGDVLGMEPEGAARWVARGESRHGLVVYDPAPADRGRMGAGTMHHVAFAIRRPSGQALPTSDRREGPELRGRCCKTFWLRTGPCRALGADPPREAELRGDLACRRLGSERKYVKRIHARDTGKAGRQFAR
jgi:hypothetical protein